MSAVDTWRQRLGCPLRLCLLSSCAKEQRFTAKSARIPEVATARVESQLANERATVWVSGVNSLSRCRDVAGQVPVQPSERKGSMWRSSWSLGGPKIGP